MSGWPSHLHRPLAWNGRDFAEEEYIYHFSNAYLDEKLGRLSTDLHEGKGFFMLRGLDSAQYSAEDNVLIYLGLSSRVGEIWGKQDEEGNILR